MALIGLEDIPLKLILFGGKGGVGKTTCAVSTALSLSKNFKTLLISTDPAHSLSDSIEQEVGTQIKELRGIKNLYALEISAEKALCEFKLKYKDEIKNILDSSTKLDEEDIDLILDLPIPGIDEVMGFKTILDLIEEAKFEKYVVDTAPTGHALRLITLPALLDDWIKVLARMRWKYRFMVERFSGKYNPDSSDDFLLNMKKTTKKIEKLLRNNLMCEFIPVTIPEDMAILETERLINVLYNYGIKVKQLVINNVFNSHGCEFCRTRSNEQEKHVKLIAEKFHNLTTTIAPLESKEVKGIESLENFKKRLFSNGK
ncbi:MAG: ArsA family ATPase [Ignavibacteriales bacterium]|nr:ArsA family ATPase [Ignavibacteriales bacterium]